MDGNKGGGEKGTKTSHYVLVHGASHGGWCWYKVRTLLEEAGQMVTCVDLKSAGIDPTNADILLKFDDYNQPLVSVLSSLPESQKVILVGHSLGGYNVTHGLYYFTNKIQVGVYLAAAMVKKRATPSSTRDLAIPKKLDQPLKEITSLGLDPDIFDWGYGLGPDEPPTSAIMKKEYQRQFYYNMSPLEVILVGHSFGGCNVTQALYKFPTKIQAVVYLAASMVKKIPSSSSTLKSQHYVVKQSSDFSPDMFEWGYGLGPDGPPTSRILKKEYQRQFFYSMSPLEDSTLAEMLLKPYPLIAAADYKLPDGDDSEIEKVPRVYIKTLHDNLISQESQDSMIKDWPPSDVLTINSDHSAFFSNPTDLVNLILKVASKYV